ncbi:MAG: hypothetical protein ABW007_04015 [Chitinophagaceae bacterium]
MKYEIRLAISEHDCGKVESAQLRQSAQSIITISPGKSDVKPLTIEQQIQKVLTDPDYKNRLGEIVGKWPGDETVEEILNGLD